MIFDVLTIFPELLDSPLKEGIIRRAVERQQIEVNIVNIRDFTSDVHSMTDDRPFGGGEGMVMKPEPLAEAVRSRKSTSPDAKTILLSPQGARFDQRMAEKLVRCRHLILVCGRYEGVDERFTARYVDEELSIGDFILTGGELAAMLVIDSVTRLVPKVLGCSDSVKKDTFSRNLLKHPQYTRPRVFENMAVPDILLSGNHKDIEEYRFVQSIQQTLTKRPELLSNLVLTRQEKKLLKKRGLLAEIERFQQDNAVRR